METDVTAITTIIFMLVSWRHNVEAIKINEFSKVRVFQCKIEIDRLVKRCGMFSHTMDVQNGKQAYVQEVSRTDAHLWNL